MIDPDDILRKPDQPPVDRALLEAAWRYQLIAPLVGDFDDERKQQYRRRLLSEPVHHPWRGEIRLSARTLRRWCQRYRKERLRGLVTGKRKDDGCLRAFPMEALERALELRQEDARRSVPQLIRLLEDTNPAWKGVLKRPTLDRHLRARGCFKVRSSRPQGPFGSFEASGPGELWQGDVLHGPVTLFGDKPRRCRIICWLDDYSRFVCHLEAYPDETLPSVEDSLKKAILKYGRPRACFVDNAWVYSGKTFTLACAELAIHKIHSTPRYPVSRGKQERLFRTLRDQVIGEVENLEPLPVEELNRYLVAWVDSYHRRKHSRTKQAPLERFAGGPLRPVASIEQLEQAFWQWDTREVSTIGEIKFAGNVYRVDFSFSGRKVVIRYDPFDLSRIYLWQDGQKVATATPDQLLRRRRRGRAAPPRTKNSEAAHRYLKGLAKVHDQRLAQELNLINYSDLPNPHKEDSDDDSLHA